MALTENARGSGGRTPTSSAIVPLRDANDQVSVQRRPIVGLCRPDPVFVFMGAHGARGEKEVIVTSRCRGPSKAPATTSGLGPATHC